MTTKIALVYSDKDITKYVSKDLKDELRGSLWSQFKSLVGIEEKTYELLKLSYDPVNDTPEKIITNISQNEPDIIVVDPFSMAIKYCDCDGTCDVCECESSPGDYDTVKYKHFLDLLKEIKPPTIIATFASDDSLIDPIKERELPYFKLAAEFNELGDEIKKYMPAEES